MFSFFSSSTSSQDCMRELSHCDSDTFFANFCECRDPFAGYASLCECSSIGACNIGDPLLNSFNIKIIATRSPLLFVLVKLSLEIVLIMRYHYF